MNIKVYFVSDIVCNAPFTLGEIIKILLQSFK